MLYKNLKKYSIIPVPMIKKIKSAEFLGNKRNLGLAKKKLLFIIAAIALISAISFVVFNRLNLAELKNRDTQRIKDLEQFIKSLENYYELYEVYPCGDTNDLDNLTNPKGTYDSSGTCGELNSDVYGFLNGVGSQKSVSVSNCLGYAGGLFSVGLINTNCPMDPLNDISGNPPHLYWYTISADRQLYVISTYLESNDAIMAKDNGLCPGWYEVGSGVGTISGAQSTTLGYGCNPKN